jgi:ATP-dependent Clp protease ATP-binding subunit ClpA
MTDDSPTLTPRMKHTLQRAGELARARGHAYVGTEHVILALIEDPSGIAGAVMQRLACAATVRDEILRIIESDGYSRRSPSPSDAGPPPVASRDAD